MTPTRLSAEREQEIRDDLQMNVVGIPTRRSTVVAAALARELLAEIDALRRENAACKGEDFAADPSKWSHADQIEGLTFHLATAHAEIARLREKLTESLAQSDKYRQQLEHRTLVCGAKEAEIARLTEALREFIDAEDCRMRGRYCQTHGQAAPCPQVLAKEVMRATESRRGE